MVGFSTSKVESTPIFHSSGTLYIVKIVWNTSDLGRMACRILDGTCRTCDKSTL